MLYANKGVDINRYYSAVKIKRLSDNTPKKYDPVKIYIDVYTNKKEILTDNLSLKRFWYL